MFFMVSSPAPSEGGEMMSDFVLVKFFYICQVLPNKETIKKSSLYMGHSFYFLCGCSSLREGRERLIPIFFKTIVLKTIVSLKHI
jgi:hypothetical protein